MELKFEDIPQAIGELLKKIDSIEVLLSELKPQPRKNEGLLTIQQVSELIHLQVPTIYAYVHKKEIPFSKKGKRLYFSKPEILEWINQGKNKSFSQVKEDVEYFLNSKRK
jgi:excisionase family DNA binding protein